MKQTETQLRAHKKYLSSLDEIKIRSAKGTKDVFKAQAAYRGLSLNSYVLALLERDGYLIEQEKEKNNKEQN